jgi:sugar transferase (PEP-CTERM/EpsH1 system associated)
LVTDLVDIDSEKFFDYTRITHGLKRWICDTEARRVRALEQHLGRVSRAVAVVSEREEAVYRSFSSEGRVLVTPNGVSAAEDRTQETRQDVVFVGVMDYPPNVDAVTWFADEVWDRVRSAVPGATFRIVGRSPSPAVEALARRPGVNVTGAVDDVKPFVSAASVVVVPLRVARGIQNKLLEALAAGRATVASPAALAPLGLQPGRDVLRAESPSEWADAVTRLLNDPLERQRLGTGGRDYVRRCHDWSANLRPLCEAVREAAGGYA